LFNEIDILAPACRGRLNIPPGGWAVKAEQVGLCPSLRLPPVMATRRRVAMPPATG